MTDEAWWHHSQGDPANVPFGCNCKVCKEKHWPDPLPDLPPLTVNFDSGDLVKINLEPVPIQLKNLSDDPSKCKHTYVTVKFEDLKNLKPANPEACDCNCGRCCLPPWDDGPDDMIPQETLHTDWTGSATYQQHQRTIVESATGGKKGTKKARFDLIDQGFLWSLAEVCGFGAGIYGDNNWRKGYDWSLSYAALMRHLSLFLQGEDLDTESGMPHIAHVAWHAMVLYVFSTDGLYREYDTRGEQG